MKKFNVIYSNEKMLINLSINATRIVNCNSHFEAIIDNENDIIDIIAIIPINAIIFNEEFAEITSSRM